MQDHYSTSGTLGLGLPGVRRMMSELTISTPPEGNSGAGPQVAGRGALVSRPIPPLACTGQLHAGLQLTWASESRPAIRNGSPVIWPSSDRGRRVSLILIDVSGHGASANKLVQVLEAALQQTHEQEPARLLQLLHQHCIGTRGAAASVALVNGERGELSYAGIGNTRICLRGHEPWRGISRDGVLGERFPLPAAAPATRRGDVVMLYSDGISESLNLRDGALDLAAEPAQLARQVIAHSGRSTDDASCIVLRCAGRKGGLDAATDRGNPAVRPGGGTHRPAQGDPGTHLPRRNSTFVAPLAGATSELVRQLVASYRSRCNCSCGWSLAHRSCGSRSRLTPHPQSRTAANHVASDWSRARTTPSPWSTACPAGR